MDTNNKALVVLRLCDVIGAKATPATGALQDVPGGVGADNNHESLVYRLEVFAYVPGGSVKEKGAGCSSSGG